MTYGVEVTRPGDPVRSFVEGPDLVVDTPVETTLRSRAWDGPAPVVGDVLDDGTHAWTITRVAHGVGPGQFTMTVRRCRLYRFSYADEPT